MWTAFAEVLFTFGGGLVSSTLTKMSIFFFLFFLLAMSEFFTYVRGLVTPIGRGFPSPLFLGVAIGLELRIRL